MDVAAIAQQQLIAERTADPKTDIVAQNCAGRCGRYDQRNVEIVRRAGIDGGRQQHRLARKGNPDALDTDEQHDDPIAVDRNQLIELMTAEMHASQLRDTKAPTVSDIAIVTARTCVARSIEARSER